MLREKSFDTGELTLNYAEGPASGPPLLLLHGLTGWWQSFQPLIPRLTPTWQIYACDLRGHGKSGRVADRYRLTDYVQDIVTFLRQQIITPTILLGHSLGALTALGAAADLPQRVHALVLLDPRCLTGTSVSKRRPSLKAGLAGCTERRQRHNHTQTYLPGAGRWHRMLMTGYQDMADNVSCAHGRSASRVMISYWKELTWNVVAARGRSTLLIRGDWDDESTSTPRMQIW